MAQRGLSTGGLVARPVAGLRIEQADLPWLLVVAMGLGLALGSLLPLPELVGNAEDLQVGAFATELLAQLPLRLRLVGAGLVALGLALYPARRALGVYLYAARAAWPALLADARRALIEALRPRSVLDGLALLAIGSSAIVLRLIFLWQPMRNDEALTVVEFANRPLFVALSYYPAPNNHLFHTLLVHLTSRLLGDDVWAVRLPALIAGILLVPATLVLGQMRYGRPAGLLGAALVATSSILVEYSTNARGYTLVALLFIAGLGLAHYVANARSAAGALAFAVLAAFGFWTVPTELYAYGALLLCLVMTWRGPGRVHELVLPTVLVTVLLTAIVYVPPALASGPERILANRWLAQLSIDTLPHALGDSLVETWSGWTRDIPVLLVWLLVGGFIVYQVRAAPRSISIALLVWCVPLLLLQRVAPYPRVWLFLLPVFLLEAAAGVLMLARGRSLMRWFAPVLAASVVGVTSLGVYSSGSVLNSDDTGVFPQAQPIAHALVGNLGPNDTVQTCVARSLPELQYYFSRLGLDPAALLRMPSRAQRLYVIVQRDLGECDGADLGERRVDLRQWRAPTAIAAFESVTLLELEPLG